MSSSIVRQDMNIKNNIHLYIYNNKNHGIMTLITLSVKIILCISMKYQNSDSS